MIGHIIGHYRILEKIAAGGMGEVYLAADTKLGRQVALKFLPANLDPSSAVLERFRREARAAAALDHPNIVTVHEVGEHEDRPFIVMSYVRGETLSAKIRGRQLTQEQALRYAIQLAEALAHAHQAGVVHRDIKPDNVLVDAEDRPRILDFGLAKLEGVTRLTREASTLGTIYYMSPEQARGAEVGEQSDIYSLGVVLYEMIAGQLPFTGEQAATILHAITTQEAPPLARFARNVSPELERIVAKAMAKDLRERYASASDLLADLYRESRLSGGIAPVQRGRAPRRLPMLAGAALIVVLGAVLWVRLGGRDRAPSLAGDTLAVMYFDNLIDPTDQQRIGEILTNLLITELSETEGLSVVSSQRLYDILKLQGKEGVRSLDRETSTAVAQRAGARWMLLGSILQLEPQIVVTSQVVEVAEGTVASSQRVSGAVGGNVFSVSDQLLSELEQDLALAPEGKAPSERIHATDSEVAYRHYLEGMEFANRYFWQDAETSFQRALEADSTLALASYELAQANFRTSEELRRAHIAQAMRHAAKLGERDRILVRHTHAQLNGRDDESIRLLQELSSRYGDDKMVQYKLGLQLRRVDPAGAIRHYLRCIEIDPLYKLPYNQLAYVYNDVGDSERSMWAINKYIELAPDEPNPYDSRGELHALSGRIDEAIASYQRALDVSPRFHPSRIKLGAMYMARFDYARAEESFRELIQSDAALWRANGRSALAIMSLRQGRFREGIERAQQGVAADRLEGVSGDPYFDKLALLAMAGVVVGDRALTDAALEALPSFADGAVEGWDDVAVEAYARRGDFERARAAFAKLTASPDAQRAKTYILLARGALALAEGDLDLAIEQYEASMSIEATVWNQAMLGLCYLKAGRIEESIAAFERSLDRYDFSWSIDPISSTEQLFYAAQAYESAGRFDRAIELYKGFLARWGDGDPGLPHVETARARLEQLAP